MVGLWGCSSAGLGRGEAHPSTAHLVVRLTRVARGCLIIPVSGVYDSEKSRYVTYFLDLIEIRIWIYIYIESKCFRSKLGSLDSDLEQLQLYSSIKYI